MSDAHERGTNTTTSLPSLNEAMRWLRMAGTALFGLALLGVGLLGAAITLLLPFGGAPDGEYWAIGTGAFSAGLLYLGGKTVCAVWRTPQVQVDQRDDEIRPEPEEPESEADDPRATGRFALVEGLRKAGPVVRTALLAWYFFLPVAAAGGVLVLFGIVIAIEGIADGFAWTAFGGGALGALGITLVSFAARGISLASDAGEEEEQT